MTETPKLVVTVHGHAPPPPVGQVLRQVSPVRQIVDAEKTDDDALPKVARPVNHD